MKKLFCMLCISASLPLQAADTDTQIGALLSSQNLTTAYDSAYTGPFARQNTAINPMFTFPIVNKGKFSLFGAVDQGISGWDKKTRTLRLSDQLGLGAVKNGSFGRGIGLKHYVSSDTTVWVAGIRNRDTGRNVFTLGLNLTF
jgi:hypothetical protein